MTDPLPLPAFDLALPTRVRFGRGIASAALEDAVAPSRRALLVHGRDRGRADWAVAAVARGGAEVATLACLGEPDLPLLEAALERLRGAGIDLVVAVGGGAAVDLGKALAALLPSPHPPRDHLEVVGRGLPLAADPLSFVAVPTTAGTGAEATRNAVIGVPDARRKVSLRDPRMLPRLALVDPALTDGCPWAVTLASGLDAVTQVIEPYVSAKAQPMTDALVRAAIPRGLAALVRLGETPDDPAARDTMAWVSLTGGIALANAGLGAVHGLAGVIGGHVPGATHGAVCGTLLPHVLRANAAAVPAGDPAAARLGEVAGWIDAALPPGPGDPSRRLARWARDRGLPSLSDMGVAAEDHGAIAAAAQASSSMAGNPVPLSDAHLVEILAATG
ncbi:iron-containing alcohol dehydrogenase [Rhodobacteraceae bacterium CCMM004]|nr:iron-containing alcohol dehydrogenase [Rhodobacteraceae bacterium CCMM004]